MLGIFALLFAGIIIGYGLAVLMHCASTYSRNEQEEISDKNEEVK